MESAKAEAEVLHISKCRYGDPITAIGIGNTSVLTGSIMGRIVHYSIETKIEREIVDMSTEMIREISLTPDGQYYNIANGDIGWHILPENGLAPLRSYTVTIHPETRAHAEICMLSYTFQCKNYCCILILGTNDKSGPVPAPPDEDIIVISSLDNQRITRVTNKDRDTDLLSYDSIPCDFDGQNLLWLNVNPDKSKTVNLFNVQTLKYNKSHIIPAAVGYVSNVKLFGNHLILTRNHQQIVNYDLESNTIVKEIGFHKSTILSISLDYISPTELDIASLDEDGVIKIHRGEALIKEIDMSKLLFQSKKLDMVELFGMGYPYFMKKVKNIIVVSSDEGAIIIKLL